MIALLLALQLAPLQPRIDAARPGDTVHLAAGRYRGPVRVRISITLAGRQGAELDGGGLGSALLLAADSIVVSGLRVTNSGRSLDDDDAAIRLERCHGCRISNTRIDRALHGIYLLESHGVRITANTIVGDTLLEAGRRGNGIHLFNSAGTLVRNNRIRQTRDGIYFAGSDQTLVELNDVREVRYGLHYMYSHDNVFRRNTFRRNVAGAAVMVSRRITLEENTFSEHTGYGAYGLLLQTAEDITVERNRIEGNLTGLFVDASMRNTFRANVIRGNGIGIDLLASSEQNRFSENIIDDNRVAVRKVLGGGDNDWAVSGRGNYWGTSDVFDLNGDGIGERSHRVGDAFSSLAARRPVLDIFSGTPAARALNWAEEAFPVFATPRVEDPAPLARAPDERRRGPPVLPFLAAGCIPLLARLARRSVRA